MIALSRGTTETIQPYEDCIMRDSPRQPPSLMRKGAWRREDDARTPTAVPQERGM